MKGERRIKKLVCVLLVLAMCLGMGASALADGGAELPDVADYLARCLADYDPTAEVHTLVQNDNAVALSIENVTDMDEVLEHTIFALDVMFWCFDFDSVSELEEEPDQTQWETTYSYPDGGVGTVTSPIAETECNACFAVENEGDHVRLVVAFGDGISVKSSDADTDTGADTPDTGADNILPDAWAFFREEISHGDKFVTNGRSAYFGVEEEDKQAIYEYADLLLSGRFGFTLTETWEEVDMIKEVFYVFDYPDTGPDMEITKKIDDRDVSGDLIVVLTDCGYDMWTDLSVTFSDVLTVVDTGDRCTDTELTDFFEDVSSSSTGPMGSGASDPADVYPHPTPGMKCYKCHGDGKVECTQCDGAGGNWLYYSAPDYDVDGNTADSAWEPCFWCHGSGEMTCPVCGGSGKL